MSNSDDFIARPTRPADIDPIIDLCAEVYPGSYSWGPNQLSSHLEIFPEGQFVVEERKSSRIVGMAASLIVDYADFTLESKWKDLTTWGYFENHAPETGRTLYGAEIMVHPEFQGRGLGKLLYQEREKLARTRNLLNIRAGARIRGYHARSEKLSAREYLRQVIRGELSDATLSFQLKRGFRVIGLTRRYFYDPESEDYAAVIEWLNPKQATAVDYAFGDPDFVGAGQLQTSKR